MTFCRDFRIPKKNDKKAWNELRKERDTFDDDIHFSRHMIKNIHMNVEVVIFQNLMNFIKKEKIT